VLHGASKGGAQYNCILPGVVGCIFSGYYRRHCVHGLLPDALLLASRIALATATAIATATAGTALAIQSGAIYIHKTTAEKMSASDAIIAGISIASFIVAVLWYWIIMIRLAAWRRWRRNKAKRIVPVSVQVKKKKKHHHHEEEATPKIDFQHRRGRRGIDRGHVRSNKVDWDKFNEHDHQGEVNRNMKPPGGNPLME